MAKKRKKKNKLTMEEYTIGLRDLINEAKHMPPHLVLGNLDLIIANLTMEVWNYDPETEKD